MQNLMLNLNPKKYKNKTQEKVINEKVIKNLSFDFFSECKSFHSTNFLGLVFGTFPKGFKLSI